MTRFLTLLLPVVLFAPAGLAQAPGAPAEGQRVRVAHRCKVEGDHLVDCRRYGTRLVATGELRAVEADTVWVRTDTGAAALAIPVQHVTQMWVIDGKRTLFKEGMWTGMLLGPFVGGVVAERPEEGVLIGLACGPWLGGIVGALIKTDRWREVPIARPRVSIDTRWSGIAMRVSLAF